MEIVDPRSGLRITIRDPEGYWEEVSRARTCEHPATEMRCWTQRNGATAARHQCLSCGAGVGNPAGGVDRAALAPADDGIRQAWELRRRAAEDAIAVKYIDAETLRSEAWWSRYNDYLNSDEWRSRRALVLKRCDWTCEGCGTAAATEVHHMTYDHVFEEFLFELKGLCHACHERWHASERPA